VSHPSLVRQLHHKLPIPKRRRGCRGRRLRTRDGTATKKCPVCQCCVLLWPYIGLAAGVATEAGPATRSVSQMSPNAPYEAYLRGFAFGRDPSMKQWLSVRCCRLANPPLCLGRSCACPCARLAWSAAWLPLLGQTGNCGMGHPPVLNFVFVAPTAPSVLTSATCRRASSHTPARLPTPVHLCCVHMTSGAKRELKNIVWLFENLSPVG